MLSLLPLVPSVMEEAAQEDRGLHVPTEEEQPKSIELSRESEM